jgi:hypothetical protein
VLRRSTACTVVNTDTLTDTRSTIVRTVEMDAPESPQTCFDAVPGALIPRSSRHHRERHAAVRYLVDTVADAVNAGASLAMSAERNV